MERLINILKQNEKITDWIVVNTVSKSNEVFLIKDKVDMNRSCVTNETSVRVFVDFEENGDKFKGDSTVVLNLNDSEDEIKEKIDRTAFAAKFVKNKYYELPEKEDGYATLKDIKVCEDLTDNFKKVHDVIYKDYGYKSKVNSCEIFAYENHKHVVTSKGVDVEYPSNKFTFEIVTDCNVEDEPVEIFNGYDLTSIDYSKIEEIVDKQLLETEKRSSAVRNEKMENMRVILSNEAVEEFLYYYYDQARDAMIYQQISSAKLGERFFGDNPKVNFNMKINPTLETSINKRPVDSEGKKLVEYDLYKNGVVENLVTNAKYSYYLNVKNMGQSPVFEVSGGDISVEELKSQDYIEVLAFSSFLMDSATGDFGGEFRLARLVKDGVESFITGGSISLNVKEVQDSMIFSKELKSRKNSLAPAVIAFDNVTIAGK